MLQALAGDPCRVVAAAYWLEDRQIPGSAGFQWQRWRGLQDVCVSSEWIELNQANSGRYLPVTGVATTVTLVPAPLLRAIRLPNPKLHPHHRYDAILSARLRGVGAGFCCATRFLADHLYGSFSQRPSVRKMYLGQFLHESFVDSKSIWHLVGGFALAWEVAPDPLQRSWTIILRLIQFVRQLGWVCFNSIRPQRWKIPAGAN
jgi:hypothetical protein